VQRDHKFKEDGGTRLRGWAQLPSEREPRLVGVMTSSARRCKEWLAALLLTLSFLTGTNHVARAETSEVRLALIFGLGYLPAYVVRDHKLLEKHAHALGLPDVKLTISKVGGGPVANEMLLSGVADLAAGGSTVLMTLWDRTRTRDNVVRGVLSLSDMPVYLITTDPRIRSIADYTDEDRIAVSGVKVTLPALLLQMAAAKQFGWDQRFPWRSPHRSRADNRAQLRPHRARRAPSMD
jgi:NitT/TauT family transport system substrate-binding protein